MIKEKYGIDIIEDVTVKRRLLNEYHIFTSDNNHKYFLKRYPEKGRGVISESNLNNLASITNYLIDNGVKTPKILKTIEKKNCIKIEKTWCVLFDYYDTEASSCCGVERIAAVTSNFHDVLRKATIEPFESWMLSVYDYGEITENLFKFDDYIIHKKANLYCEEQLYLDNRDKICAFIKAYADFVSEIEHSFLKQFVHGDLNPENILNSADGIAIIDLDSTHFGSVLEDYATITSHIFGEDSTARFEVQKEQYKIFRNNYRQREEFGSSVIFRAIICDLLKNMSILAENWRLVSRFEVPRRVLKYTVKQLILFIDNQKMFELLL